MKRLLISFLVILLYTSGTSATRDTSFKYIGVAGVNANQASFTNWTQGGDNSLSWTVFSNLGMDYADSLWRFGNRLKLSYGRSKIGSTEFRTNDNELYLESVLAYKIGWRVDPYFSNTVRSTITYGYDYKSSLTEPISNFFDPGYITQSLGFTYNESKSVFTRLGLGLQEVITNKHRNFTDDANSAGKLEAFKLEAGFESVSDAQVALDENLQYQSKLRLFTRFQKMGVWDVRWDNTVTAKVTKYINVNLNVLVVYEKSQSLKTQLKQALQMGLTYSFL